MDLNGWWDMIKEGNPDFIYYDRISIYLLEIIKQQQQQIAKQAEQIDALQKQVKRLENIINTRTVQASDK